MKFYPHSDSEQWPFRRECKPVSWYAARNVTTAGKIDHADLEARRPFDASLPLTLIGLAAIVWAVWENLL